MAVTIPAFSTTASITGQTMIADADGQLNILMSDVKDYVEDTYTTVASSVEAAVAVHATSALASKNAAATSASAAATSATNAASSATSALASKNAAATSETNALASKNAAATSATAAATSATNSASSATSSATSAAASLASKNAAATSEANALASKNAAATSATTAASNLTSMNNALQNFGSMYIGAFASHPTIGAFSGTIKIGSSYFNTTSNVMYVYSSTGWIVPYIDNSNVYTKDEVQTALPKAGFNINNVISPSIGQLAWNQDEGTLDLGLSNMTLQMGQEQVIKVRNNTASTILNGRVVMATGTIGNSGRITVAPANLTSANARYILGVLTQDIAAGTDGFCTVFGKVRGIQTNGANYSETWVDGDVLYAKDSGSGALTKVIPTDTQVKLPVAIVISAHATNGTLFIRINSIDENHAKAELALKAPLASPALTGTPTAPTAVVGTSTTQVATTAFVNAEIQNDSTTANTANLLVRRDASGNFNAGTVTAALAGNASTATTLQTARTIDITGDLTYTSGTFNGSANVTGVGTLVNTGVTAGTYRSVTTDAKGRITAGTNPTTVSGYGLTDVYTKTESNTSLALKVNNSEKGVANGLATLDVNGKVVLTQIPDSVLGQLEYMGTWNFTTLPTATQKGQYWIASTSGNGYVVGDWSVWNGTAFDKVDNTDAVTTVAGRIGNVVLTKTDVGLANVDNTTDSAKPVSTAQQAALNLKANIASPTFTGIPSAPTASIGTNTTQVATTAYVITEINKIEEW